MGRSKLSLTCRAKAVGPVRIGFLLSLVAFLCVTAGCQMTQQASVKTLVERRSVIDLSDLAPLEDVETVKASLSAPRSWSLLPLHKMGPMTHQQWKSPSGNTGVGVAYIRLPLPLSAKTLMWLAKGEYRKKENDGKLLDQWTDDLGRPWFEAENNKYRVRGYVTVKGFDAWIIYCGYKRAKPLNPEELSLAVRSVSTIIPTPMLSEVETN